jgi:hypothetical protein
MNSIEYVFSVHWVKLVRTNIKLNTSTKLYSVHNRTIHVEGVFIEVLAFVFVYK